MKQNLLAVAILLLCICVPKHAAAIATEDEEMLSLDVLIVEAQAYFNSVLQDLADTEKENEESLQTAKLDTAATIAATAKGESAIYASTLKQHAMTQMTIKNNREYSTLSQAAFDGCAESLGVGLIQGTVKLKEYQKSLYDKIAEYNNKYTSKNRLYNDLIPAADKFKIDRSK